MEKQPARRRGGATSMNILLSVVTAAPTPSGRQKFVGATQRARKTTWTPSVQPHKQEIFGRVWSLAVKVLPNLTHEGEDLCEPGGNGADKLLQNFPPCRKKAGSKGNQKMSGIKSN